MSTPPQLHCSLCWWLSLAAYISLGLAGLAGIALALVDIARIVAGILR